MCTGLRSKSPYDIMLKTSYRDRLRCAISTASTAEVVRTMAEALRELTTPILEPMDRIAETLFGVIMALTFTCTLGAQIGDDIKVRTMLIAALGCNLAWGIIDAGVYLITQINIESRKVTTLGALR